LPPGPANFIAAKAIAPPMITMASSATTVPLEEEVRR
jgi:hypothetical protein